MHAPSTPLGPAGPAPVGPAGRGPRPVGNAADRTPELHLLGLIRGFAAVYLEVEAGRRDARQLGGLVTPRLAVRLGALMPVRSSPGRVLAVAGSRSRPDRFDGVAVVCRGRRCGAVAVRLVLVRGRWLVDQAGRPEDSLDNGRPARSLMAPGPALR
jgi:hypothetical protein